MPKTHNEILPEDVLFKQNMTDSSCLLRLEESCFARAKLFISLCDRSSFATTQAGQWGLRGRWSCWGLAERGWNSGLDGQRRCIQSNKQNWIIIQTYWQLPDSGFHGFWVDQERMQSNQRELKCRLTQLWEKKTLQKPHSIGVGMKDFSMVQYTSNADIAQGFSILYMLHIAVPKMSCSAHNLNFVSSLS